MVSYSGRALAAVNGDVMPATHLAASHAKTAHYGSIGKITANIRGFRVEWLLEKPWRRVKNNIDQTGINTMVSDKKADSSRGVTNFSCILAQAVCCSEKDWYQAYDCKCQLLNIE